MMEIQVFKCDQNGWRCSRGSHLKVRLAHLDKAGEWIASTPYITTVTRHIASDLAFQLSFKHKCKINWGDSCLTEQ